MADRLLALVIANKKTATSCPLELYKKSGEALPFVGQKSILQDSAGNPRCLIETIEVTVMPFDEVGEQFAFDEGEGDRSLDSWRAEHKTFTERHTLFSESMAFVCERFRVVKLL